MYPVQYYNIRIYLAEKKHFMLSLSQNGMLILYCSFIRSALRQSSAAVCRRSWWTLLRMKSPSLLTAGLVFVYIVCFHNFYAFYGRCVLLRFQNCQSVSIFFSRLFDRVDLIKPVSNVRLSIHSSIHPYVCMHIGPSVHKKFLWF